MKKNKTVEEFLSTCQYFKKEVSRLISIVRQSELEETIKWGMPVYCYKKKNVLGLGEFKSYFGLWFFEGALLTDNEKVLINAQEGRTQAMRQYRLKTMDDIDEQMINR